MKNTKWLLLSVLFISSLFGQIDIKVSDGYKVNKVEACLSDGKIASSSLIRKYISLGNVVSANNLLGRLI